MHRTTYLFLPLVFLRRLRGSSTACFRKHRKTPRRRKGGSVVGVARPHNHTGTDPLMFGALRKTKSKYEARKHRESRRRKFKNSECDADGPTEEIDDGV